MFENRAGFFFFFQILMFTEPFAPPVVLELSISNISLILNIHFSDEL